jgi:hypothetical protein
MYMVRAVSPLAYMTYIVAVIISRPDVQMMMVVMMMMTELGTGQFLRQAPNYASFCLKMFG